MQDTTPVVELDLDFSASEEDIFIGGVKDVREEEGFSYPAMLLSNVQFNDCVRILKDCRKESYRLVDVWMELADGTFERAGTLQLGINTLLTLRFLGIRVTVYLDEKSIEVIDGNDPVQLEKYI